MFRSFQTRIHGDHTVLERYAALMSRAERKLFALLQAGRQWKGDLHKTLYPDLGISATHLDIAYRQLLGRLKSARDLGLLHIRELETRLATAQKTLARRQMAVAKAKQAISTLVAEGAAVALKIMGLKAHLGKQRHLSLRILPLKTLLDARYRKRKLLERTRGRLKTLLRHCHFGQRKVQKLTRRIEQERRRLLKPSICFGGRDLFRDCFHGHRQGGATRWQENRNRSFTIEGDSSRQSGNPFARLTSLPNGTFDLELRLPPAIRGLAEVSYKVKKYQIYSVMFESLTFPHGDKPIRDALSSRKPLTLKFIKDQKSWRVMVTVLDDLPEVTSSLKAGALGVDFNAAQAAAAFIDANGNPGRALSVPVSTRGLSASQSTDLIRKAAARLVKEAKTAGMPLAIEQLDFSRKRNVSDQWRGPRYRSALHRFPYAKFREAMLSAAARNGVRLFQVVSENSSLLGRQRFARRYGLSVHHAAAVVIARRAILRSDKSHFLHGRVPGKSVPWHPTATREERKACTGQIDDGISRIGSGGTSSAQSVGGPSPTRRVYWLDSG